MKLEQLLGKLDYELDSGSLDTEISGLVYDSRAVAPGSLFVPM